MKDLISKSTIGSETGKNMIFWVKIINQASLLIIIIIEPFHIIVQYKYIQMCKVMFEVYFYIRKYNYTVYVYVYLISFLACNYYRMGAV